MDDTTYEALFARLETLGGWEHPPGFSHAAAEARARAFVHELQAETSQSLDLETGELIQDASFHSEVRLVGGILRFSAYGDMIALTPDHSVALEVIAAIRVLASRAGYVFVPTEVLERPYPAKDAIAKERIRDWWIRFFDYL